jgi:LAO/AO transport system kinase
MSSSPTATIAAEFRAGSVRALSRAISMAERRDAELADLLGAVGRPKNRHVVGITGAPGVGKSTLLSAMILHQRERGQTIGVVAIDPSSPYTGGALLGDRVRMQRHTLDQGVFVRSMATRGHLGGLSLAVPEALFLLNAFGFDHVIVETVGTGQSEREVTNVADTTVVALAPGMGDSVQVLKAGIMEIADVFVINKADQPGADRLAREVRSMLNLGAPRAWRPLIVKTNATGGDGVPDLWDTIARHRTYLSGSVDETAQAEARLREAAANLVGEIARARALHALQTDAALMEGLRVHRLPHLVAPSILKRCAG